MATQLLTSYSQVVSSNNSNSAGNNKNYSSSTYFDNRDDVNLIDSSMTETLAFKYDFKDEKQAIKEYEDWQKDVIERKEQVATLKEILGFDFDGNSAFGTNSNSTTNNKRSSADTQQERPSQQQFNVNNIIPTITGTINNTMGAISGRFQGNNLVKTDNDESFSSKMNDDPDYDASKVRRFREYTGATEAKATEFLKSFDWEVDTAVKHYFDQ